MSSKKMETTEKQIGKFIFEYGIEPFFKICSGLSRESWYRKYFAPKISKIKMI